MGVRMRAVLMAVLLALPAIAQDAERIDELIRQLGSDETEVRDRAERELGRIGRPAYEAVKAAAESDDPEVRFRALRVLPRVRWGLSEIPPERIQELLAGLEETHGEPELPFAERLLFRDKAITTDVCLAALALVDHPGALATIASPLTPSDSVRVEERLRKVPPDHPRLLAVLGDVLRYKGELSSAADAYARAMELGSEDKALPTKWAQALLRAHREGDLIAAPPRWTLGDPTPALLRVEALYRIGRREEAERALDAFAPGEDGDPVGHDAAIELAVRYGSARLVLGWLGPEEAVDDGTLVRARLRAGDADGAPPPEAGAIDPRIASRSPWRLASVSAYPGATSPERRCPPRKP